MSCCIFILKLSIEYLHSVNELEYTFWNKHIFSLHTELKVTISSLGSYTGCGLLVILNVLSHSLHHIHL